MKCKECGQEIDTHTQIRTKISYYQSIGHTPTALYLGMRQICALGLGLGLDSKEKTYLGLRVFYLEKVADHMAVS